MRFELSVLSSAAGVDVRVASDIPNDLVRAIKRVVRVVTGFPQNADRPVVTAARLVTEVARMTDFLSSPLEVGGRIEYEGLTVTIDVDKCRVCMILPGFVDPPEYYACDGNTLYVDFHAAAKWGA